MIIQRTADEQQKISTIGQRIRDFRMRKGISVKQLAHDVGYAHGNSIGHIEGGKVDVLDIILLTRIATALNLPLTKLIK